jgi:LAS superfamily LD-carboxypeptidase LdcB
VAVDHGTIKDTQAGPAPDERVAGRPAQDPVTERLTRLRAGGNRALGRLLRARRLLLRVGGWTGASATANQAEGTHHGVRRVPLEGLTGVARALVLLPPGFDPGKPVDVLVHLHGQNTGYQAATPRDLDPSLDRIEEQVKAAQRSQLVAVLPQGSSTAADYGEFGRLDPRAYAKQALEKLTALGGLASTPTIGHVVVSGHSGGGFAIKTILDDAARQKDLSGVVWFDAIQAESGPADKRASTGQREAAKRLVRDRVTAELDALPSGASDPQLEQALGSGFQFRVYYNAAGYYAGAALEIESYLKGLFGESGKPPAGQEALAARIAKLPAAARTALRSRYRTIGVTQSGAAAHATNLAAGKLDTLGHDNMVGSGALADAIGAMPFGKAPPPPTPAPKSTSLDLEHSDERVVAVSTGEPGLLLRTEDVAARLIDMTAALGHADGDPPGGLTLLRRDDIRAALTARAGNPELSRGFDGSVEVISAFEGATRENEYRAQAVGLVKMLEDMFIHDASRSTIDLLPPARAAHYRGITWGRLDYPGHAPEEEAGAQEGEAIAMAAEIARLRPERRPNLGADAVITQSQMTDAKRRRIRDNVREVDGQNGARLFDEAATAFERMARIAAFDNVELRILSSWRDPAVAAANAAASGNRMAVAAFSSHSLGLAVDIAMSGGGQHFTEMTTRPMSNVAAMRSSAAHKWMVLRAERFGWFPYGHEPWHWEYNPPGFRDRFLAIVDPPAQAPAPRAGAAAGR